MGYFESQPYVYMYFSAKNETTTTNKITEMCFNVDCSIKPKKMYQTMY